MRCEADDFATHLVFGGRLGVSGFAGVVKALEKAGELKRIKAEVDPVLEISEVVQRVARDLKRAEKSVGPALLFENRKGRGIRFL